MTLKDYENAYLKHIKANEKRTILDAQNIKNYLKTTGVGSIKGDLCFQLIPKIFDKAAFNIIENAASMMYKILEKCIYEYQQNENFRKLFGFDKELEELVLSDTGYACQLPIARIDMFFDEDSFGFKFFEFNADGASAMIEDREIGNALKMTKAYKDFEFKTKSFELFDCWVDTILNIYGDFKKGDFDKNSITVGIVDFLDKATMGEFVAFKKAFLDRGINCVIADIRELKYENEVLYDKEKNKIDLVYRRAVTSDCMERIDEISEFLAAYKNKAVCTVGGFKTQVIHNKILFSILHNENIKSIFSDEEHEFIKKHIPFSTELKLDKHFDTAKNNKDLFIIKPNDLYASVGVYAGLDYSQNDWKALLNKNAGTGYILQKYCAPFKTANCYEKNGAVYYGEYGNTTGLYLYAGKLMGLYSRQMQRATTTTQDEGRVACSWLIKNEV